MSEGRRRWDPATPWLLGLLAVAVGLVGSVRWRAAGAHHRVVETSDVYVLPPPEDVVRLSLGYRAALADLLWSHVLVSQGLHSFEKRRYGNLTVFLDTINALDPEFREPYLMADALITFQANETPEDEVRKAREIMERGTVARPLDGEIWLGLGQFVGFIAPASYLKDPVEQAQWREDGARFLAKATELSGDDSHISWQAIAGAGILHRTGERDAAIRFLRRAMAVTDDDELKAKLQPQLDKLLGEQQADVVKRRDAVFRELWRRDLPFVGKTTFLVLGPPPDPAWCAGGARSTDPRCALTWRAWAERQDAPAGPGRVPAEPTR